MVSVSKEAMMEEPQDFRVPVSSDDSTSIQDSVLLDNAITVGQQNLLLVTAIAVVREGPGLDYRVLTRIQTGERFQWSSEVNGWFQVTVNGQEGWIHKSVVEPIDSTPTTEAPN